MCVWLCMKLDYVLLKIKLRNSGLNPGRVV